MDINKLVIECFVQDGYRFAFVEFESAKSARSAVEVLYSIYFYYLILLLDYQFVIVILIADVSS